MDKALNEIATSIEADHMIAGDINVCFYCENSETNEVRDLMNSYGLRYLFSEPYGDSQRCVDNIFTNVDISNSFSINLHISDHYTEFADFAVTKTPTKKNKYEYMRVISDKNKENFLKYLEEADWSQIRGNAEASYNAFHNILLNGFEYCCPVKNGKVNKARKKIKYGIRNSRIK
ncbi:hypothetical protein HHI36_007905 [Cryptolaemus montrouzieri]|uniref:Endonuclease/exonuclease/phosphatase domain-containing protein n=1 Tax=Cryptolaemus montrouzieri TaxID=559131 RepID=A0ABD2MQV5_9CUCU